MKFDELDYKKHGGSRTDKAVVLYSLTTCMHCEQAMRFVIDADVEFEYAFMDEVPVDVKESVKKALKIHYHTPLSFPCLIVDDTFVSVGFNRQKWSEALGLVVA